MWSHRRRPHLPLHLYAEGLSAHGRGRGRRHHRRPRRTRPGRPPPPCRAGHSSFFSWPALSIALADKAADDGVEVTEEAVIGQAGPHLADASRNASLVVVGRKNRHASLGPHIGPVAHEVLHHASAPVVVVPHD
ncbi:universal stress protein [Streptomyces sp. NPDC019531]|uniref:universal stress protein n=1 Tax=Streptomyces sp. NPDC019531 TaxID=3365062 RepID=UPI00384E2325